MVSEHAVLFVQLEHETLDDRVLAAACQDVYQCEVTKTDVFAPLEVQKVRQVKAFLRVNKMHIAELVLTRVRLFEVVVKYQGSPAVVQVGLIDNLS